MADPWVFLQLGGENKVLTLEDADAPHGRPRHDPIVQDEIELRESEDFYSGNPEPTRHIFGFKVGPWQLKGRFSDRSSRTAGYCKQKLEYTRGFVADMQELLITWGDNIRARGIIKKFKVGRESPKECTWEMEILVNADERLAATANREMTPNKPLPDSIDTMQRMLFGLDDWDKVKGVMVGSVFDLISNAIDALTSPFAAMVAIASEVQSYERALLGDIKRLRARINEARTAVLTLQDTVAELTVGVAVQSEMAENQFSFSGLQADTATITNSMLLELAKTDKAAREAERGKTKGLYTAVANDTWEAISVASYGDATRADDIRKANGVDAGTPPEAGALYLIPK